MGRQRIEIPDLRDYQNEGLARAFLMLGGARMKTILSRAAELAAEGVDSSTYRVELDEEEEEEEDEETPAGMVQITRGRGAALTPGEMLDAFLNGRIRVDVEPPPRRKR